MPTVADVLVEELQARGVTFIATLNGHGLDPLFVACRHAGMRLVDMRNEQSAGYCAEVTGRLTRTVGVCAVSGAVAHANGMTGVVDAWFDGAPMLLITGTTPHTELGWGNFQDMNPVPMSEPMCKYARMIDAADRVGQIVHEAFAAATTGRPGPVHLSLPMDISETEVDAAGIARSGVRSGAVRQTGEGAVDLIDQAAELIGRATQPLLIAGSGVYYARGEAALARFARQQSMPTVVPIWDRGSVPDGLDEFVGVIGAASGRARLLGDADLIIMAGAEFDYRVGQITPPNIRDDAKVIRIHIDDARLRNGLEADVSILGSPATVLDQLATACQRAGGVATGEWLAEARTRRSAHRQACFDRAVQLRAGTNGCDVVAAVRDSLTDETILLVDGGNIGQWFHQSLTDRYPGHWVTCGASGVVGWGLGGAIAARASYPDRPVILLSGDGSFTFTVAELECAARQGLPFVAVVADDESWGISRSGQMSRFGETIHTTLGPTRLDQVATGFGCHGVRVEDKAELAPAIRAALAADRPTVIHVPIVPSSPAG
ncbi:MAG: hypothetical protein CMJ49_09480 [Planctomycetaceae bacterium]|nr:hypothetical protein [Planctomycetaceae bacterium]